MSALNATWGIWWGWRDEVEVVFFFFFLVILGPLTRIPALGVRARAPTHSPLHTEGGEEKSDDPVKGRLAESRQTKPTQFPAPLLVMPFINKSSLFKHDFHVRK